MREGRRNGRRKIGVRGGKKEGREILAASRRLKSLFHSSLGPSLKIILKEFFIILISSVVIV